VVAAFLGRAACVGVLLLHPNTNPNMADALDGTTPLLAAASAGHTDVVFFCSSSSFELPFY